MGRRSWSVAGSLALLSACVAAPAVAPAVAPTVESPVQSSARPSLDIGDDGVVIPRKWLVSIQSAYMAEDCQDAQGITREVITVGRKTRACYQSQVILTIFGTDSVWFKIVEAQVLDAVTRRLVGTVKLREPKIWDETNKVFARWDLEVKDRLMYAKFAMSEPDLIGAAERVGPTWNPEGPFVLALELELNHERGRVFSPEFPNYDPGPQ